MHGYWNNATKLASYLTAASSHHGNFVRSAASNPKVTRALATAAALYYLIPDAILIGFFAYNLIFNRDRVVWLKAQYGLQFGVTLGLRMYVVPLIYGLVQLIVDSLLTIGIRSEKRKLVSPAVIFHAIKCTLTLIMGVLFYAYLPEVTVVLETAVGHVPMKTVTVALLCFLGLEIFTWILITAHFRYLAKKIE